MFEGYSPRPYVHHSGGITHNLKRLYPKRAHCREIYTKSKGLLFIYLSKFAIFVNGKKAFFLTMKHDNLL